MWLTRVAGGMIELLVDFSTISCSLEPFLCWWIIFLQMSPEAIQYAQPTTAPEGNQRVLTTLWQIHAICKSYQHLLQNLSEGCHYPMTDLKVVDNFWYICKRDAHENTKRQPFTRSLKIVNFKTKDQEATNCFKNYQLFIFKLYKARNGLYQSYEKVPQLLYYSTCDCRNIS